MTDVELRDELITLLLAGHETTANSLAWAVERLVRTPGGLERLAGDPDYAEAVVKETLRLRPVIALVLRKLLEPPRSAGRELPAGTLVTPCILLVHRRPDVYPRPGAFRPERFLERRAGHLQLDPVRRRRAPLHRRDVRADGDAGRAADDRRAVRSRPSAAPSASRRRGITLAPVAGRSRAPRRRVVVRSRRRGRALPPARPAARRPAAARSTASARCPTSPRRTTGSAATSPSTSGSPRASPAGASSTWPAARATAPPCSRASAFRVVGVDANPDAFEHARLRYREPNLRFERDMVELFARAVRRGRVPADDRARPGPRRGARALPRDARPRRRRVRLDAERAHAGAARARSARATRGTCASTAPTSSARCARRTSARSSCYGLFHARKLRAHELALRAGWDRVHARAARHRAVLRPLRARDLRARLRAARRARPRPRARPPGGAAGRERRGPPGDRPAHPHALRRGLRDVAVRRGVAVGGDRDVLPAAARRARRRRAGHAVAHARAGDQLEAPGAIERCRAFLARRAARVARARRSTRRGDAARGGRARRSAGDYARAARARWSAAATCSARSRPHVGWTSAATHAVLPLLATDAGVRLQLRSRRSPPTARASATLARRVLAAGVRARAVAGPAARGGGRARHLRRPHRRPRPRRPAPPAPAAHRRRAAARAARPRRRSSSCGSDDGYPAHARLPRLPPPHRARPPAVGQRRRASTTRRAPRRRRARDAARLRRARRARASPAAACASARSTPSCSATGGTRGRAGWPRSSTRPRATGLTIVALDDALADAQPAPPLARRSPRTTWGTPRDLSTWSAPAGRRARVGARGARSSRRRRRRGAGDRALRELLALQSQRLGVPGQPRDWPASTRASAPRRHRPALDAALAGEDDAAVRSLAPHLARAACSSPEDRSVASRANGARSAQSGASRAPSSRRV